VRAFLSTPRRYIVGARLQLYVFLSSALVGDGQIHAPAVPPPGKDHPVPIEQWQGLGWRRSRPGPFGIKMKPNAPESCL
jgi:hypothetical protein